MNWKNFVCSVVCLAGMTCAEAVNYTPENVSASIALKVPVMMRSGIHDFAAIG